MSESDSSEESSEEEDSDEDSALGSLCALTGMETEGPALETDDDDESESDDEDDEDEATRLLRFLVLFLGAGGLEDGPAMDAILEEWASDFSRRSRIGAEIFPSSPPIHHPVLRILFSTIRCTMDKTVGILGGSGSLPHQSLEIIVR